MTNIPNHYGYGLRNDEKPYAHKIPDGGNWRSLPEEEQKAFMKGAFNSGGGQTTYLRKMSWDEPALTITASVMAKATCHLHPTDPIERGECMNEIPNHIQTKATTVKLKDGMYNQRAYVADWFKPARTVSTIGWITPKSIPNH